MRFVEREEFSHLRSSLLSQERASSVRLILGGPGVGKTTLVKALGDTLKREGWRIYSSHDAAASFVSLSQFLESLLNRINRPGGAADRLRSDMPLDERFRHALSAATNHAPALIVLDGLDEIQLDNAGTDHLAEIARAIRSSPGVHLALASREHISLWPLTCAIQPEKVFLGGLPLAAFQALCRQLGLPFCEHEEKVRSLYLQIRGLPKALELVADASEASLALLEELGKEPTDDEIYKTLYELHLQEILASLSAAEKPVLKAIFGFLAVLQENPHLRDLSGFVTASVPHAAPEGPGGLWKFLRDTGLVKLFGIPAAAEPAQPPAAPLRLGHQSLQDFLCNHHFSDGDLVSFHRQLADSFQTLSTNLGRRNLLHHLFKGWTGQPQDLADRLCQIDWNRLLTCWQEISGVSLDDLEQIWGLFQEHQREAVARKIEDALNDRIRSSGGAQLLNFLETASQLALPRRYGPFLSKLADDTLRAPVGDQLAAIRIDELKTHLQSTVGDWRLRILVDLWPGYYPLFAVEEELNQHGIFLDIVESSREKIQLLLQGKADLIATTPGCLLGSDGDNLSKLRILGVLNRSFGADKILVDAGRVTLDAHDKPVDPQQLAALPLMVTRDSTSHMFLNWFLAQLGLDPSALDIRESSDYLKGLQAALEGTVGVISTWEPYATMLLDMRREVFKVAFDSREASLVIDLLVADRTCAARLAESAEIKILGEWYDRALREDRIYDGRIAARIRARLGISSQVYDTGCKGVRYFKRSQMKPFFNKKGTALAKIFEDVARAWGGPAHVEASGRTTHRFRESMKGLFGDGIPAWLSAGPVLTQAPIFDVVLSFAGEEHEYPEELFEILSHRKYSVFYYRRRESDLVGNRLSRSLPEIYTYRSRLCVAFYSRAYADKRYTRMEFRAAKRRLRANPGSGYLMVVQIDDSWPPGLPRDLVYLTIERGLPQIADLIQEKIEAARRAEACEGSTARQSTLRST